MKLRKVRKILESITANWFPLPRLTSKHLGLLASRRLKFWSSLWSWLFSYCTRTVVLPLQSSFKFRLVVSWLGQAHANSPLVWLPSNRIWTSDWRYRRWPPRVLIAVNFPDFAHRVTVLGSTLKIAATSDGVRRTSGLFRWTATLGNLLDAFGRFAYFAK